MHSNSVANEMGNILFKFIPGFEPEVRSNPLQHVRPQLPRPPFPETILRLQVEENSERIRELQFHVSQQVDHIRDIQDEYDYLRDQFEILRDDLFHQQQHQQQQQQQQHAHLRRPHPPPPPGRLIFAEGSVRSNNNNNNINN